MKKIKIETTFANKITFDQMAEVSIIVLELCQQFQFSPIYSQAIMESEVRRFSLERNDIIRELKVNSTVDEDDITTYINKFYSKSENFSNNEKSGEIALKFYKRNSLKITINVYPEYEDFELDYVLQIMEQQMQNLAL